MLDFNVNSLITQPSLSMDAIVATEYLKGECGAWKRVLELPEELIDSNTAVIEAFKAARKEDEEDVDAS